MSHSFSSAAVLLSLSLLAPSSALLAQPARRAVLHAPRRTTPVVSFFGGSGAALPAEVREEIDSAVSTSDVMPLWQEFRKCYATEADAISAAKKNIVVLLPFINTRENIYFCNRILGDELGFSNEERVSEWNVPHARVRTKPCGRRAHFAKTAAPLTCSLPSQLEIIKANPGILANKPGQLARSSQGEVRLSINLVSSVDSIPEPLRLALPPVTGVVLVTLIAKRLAECAGGICG